MKTKNSFVVVFLYVSVILSPCSLENKLIYLSQKCFFLIFFANTFFHYFRSTNLQVCSVITHIYGVQLQIDLRIKVYNSVVILCASNQVIINRDKLFVTYEQDHDISKLQHKEDFPRTINETLVSTNGAVVNNIVIWI